jgi:hypothetical protein
MALELAILESLNHSYTFELNSVLSLGNNRCSFMNVLSPDLEQNSRVNRGVLWVLLLVINPGKVDVRHKRSFQLFM